MMQDISAILAERGNRYGRFDAHALVTQRLKQALTSGANWGYLEPDAKEALEMIVHKIGRILSGDPDYDDSWLDLAGYAQLIVDRIRRTGTYAAEELTVVPDYPEPAPIAPWAMKPGCY